MDPIVISAIVFACLFGGALIGMQIPRALGERVLSDDSKHVLGASLAVIGTLAVLVLGLLLASAFRAYEAQRNELIDLASKAVLLDRVLADYGPESREARTTLRLAIMRTLDAVWVSNQGTDAQLDPPAVGSGILHDKVEELTPRNDTQRSIKGDAISLVTNLAQTRWLMLEQLSTPFSVPLLVVPVFWFIVTFVALGLFVPHKATVVTALFLCAMAVASVVYLIQAMYTPFEGAVKLSSAPLQEALKHMGR